MITRSRFAAFAGAALIASLGAVAPAHAATTVRRAVITSVETVGGIQVVYSAEAVHLAPGPTAGMDVCAAVPVLSPVELVSAQCTLTDTATADAYTIRAASVDTRILGLEVGPGASFWSSQLVLCIYAEVTINGSVHVGPTRCQSVD